MQSFICVGKLRHSELTHCVVCLAMQVVVWSFSSFMMLCLVLQLVCWPGWWFWHQMCIDAVFCPTMMRAFSWCFIHVHKVWLEDSTHHACTAPNAPVRSGQITPNPEFVAWVHESLAHAEIVALVSLPFLCPKQKSSVKKSSQRCWHHRQQPAIDLESSTITNQDATADDNKEGSLVLFSVIFNASCRWQWQSHCVWNNESMQNHRSF